jgi:hypothetical protein
MKIDIDPDPKKIEERSTEGVCFPMPTSFGFSKFRAYDHERVLMLMELFRPLFDPHRDGGPAAPALRPDRRAA